MPTLNLVWLKGEIPPIVEDNMIKLASMLQSQDKPSEAFMPLVWMDTSALEQKNVRIKTQNVEMKEVNPDILHAIEKHIPSSLKNAVGIIEITRNKQKYYLPYIDYDSHAVQNLIQNQLGSEVHDKLQATIVNETTSEFGIVPLAADIVRMNALMLSPGGYVDITDVSLDHLPTESELYYGDLPFFCHVQIGASNIPIYENDVIFCKDPDFIKELLLLVGSPSSKRSEQIRMDVLEIFGLTEEDLREYKKQVARLNDSLSQNSTLREEFQTARKNEKLTEFYTKHCGAVFNTIRTDVNETVVNGTFFELYNSFITSKFGKSGTSKIVEAWEKNTTLRSTAPKKVEYSWKTPGGSKVDQLKREAPSVPKAAGAKQALFHPEEGKGDDKPRQQTHGGPHTT